MNTNEMLRLLKDSFNDKPAKQDSLSVVQLSQVAQKLLDGMALKNKEKAAEEAIKLNTAEDANALEANNAPMPHVTAEPTEDTDGDGIIVKGDEEPTPTVSDNEGNTSEIFSEANSIAQELANKISLSKAQLQELGLLALIANLSQEDK